MVELPMDLIEDILSRLPVRSLLRFRCVSKPWCALIYSSSFIKKHIHRSIETNANLDLIIQDFTDHSFQSVDFDTLDSLVNLNLNCEGLKTEVWGSCNGLICLSNEEQGIVLWNPSTRKHIKLPDRPIKTPDSAFFGHRGFYGVGYECSSDDYKILRIAEFCVLRSDSHPDFVSQADVFSLKLNSWSRVQDFPSRVELQSLDHKGVLAHGAFHWSAIRKTESNVPEHFIVAFDLRVEQFRLLPQPEYSDTPRYMRSGFFCGRLCTFVCSSTCSYDLWVMNDYGVKESWSKVVSTMEGDLLNSMYLKPITFPKSGSNIFLQLDMFRLFKCDIEKLKIDEVEIRGMPKKFETHLCLGSLVQLDGYGGSG